MVWEFQELSSGKMVGLLRALATLAAFAFSSDQERSLGSERVFSSNLSCLQRQNEAYAPALVLDMTRAGSQRVFFCQLLCLSRQHVNLGGRLPWRCFLWTGTQS